MKYSNLIKIFQNKFCKLKFLSYVCETIKQLNMENYINKEIEHRLIRQNTKESLETLRYIEKLKNLLSIQTNCSNDLVKLIKNIYS